MKFTQIAFIGTLTDSLFSRLLRISKQDCVQLLSLCLRRLTKSGIKTETDIQRPRLTEAEKGTEQTDMQADRRPETTSRPLCTNLIMLRAYHRSVGTAPSLHYNRRDSTTPSYFHTDFYNCKGRLCAPVA